MPVSSLLPYVASLPVQILLAILLDLLLGDPAGWPHPVRLIGRVASALESPIRRAVPHERSAGILLALAVCAGAAGLAQAALDLAGQFHPLLRSAVAVYAMYACLAMRDMERHSAAVHTALAAGDLPEARRRLAAIVGRDTEALDGPGIVRAVIESVAESSVDGVIAPLFFCFLAGPAGAVFHKAASTLDSTFGYTTEEYIRFGWASARLDDLLNWIPARLSGIFIAIGALLVGRRPADSWRIFLRDGGRHASPNAGRPEAAFAGALGVRLGGPDFYDGERVEKPAIGDATIAFTPDLILKANRLMYASGFLAAAVGFALIALMR